MEAKALCSKLNASDNSDISSTSPTTSATTANNSTTNKINSAIFNITINSSTQQQQQQQQQQLILRKNKKNEMNRNLIRDITRVITHWVLINGELTKLLQCSLNLDEREMIEEILLQLANHDIMSIDNYHQNHHQQQHAVGINACIGYMLQETKYNDAFKVCMFICLYTYMSTFMCLHVYMDYVCMFAYIYIQKDREYLHLSLIYYVYNEFLSHSLSI